MITPDGSCAGVVLASSAALVAVLLNRLTQQTRVPAPLLMFAGSAAVAAVIPAVRMPDVVTVELVVTVCLIVILFDGGLNIGTRKFRAALLPIASVGLLGTFLTSGAAGCFCMSRSGSTGT